MGIEKKVFTRKPYNNQLYKWSPDTTTKKSIKHNTTPYFCSATPNSQGEDWKGGYVYEVVILNGQQKRLAYVECDYIE